MLNRRKFLSMFGKASAAIIIAPTLAETIAIGAKKYFFLGNVAALNPLDSLDAICAIELENFLPQIAVMFEREDAFYRAIQVKNAAISRKFYRGQQYSSHAFGNPARLR